MFDETLTKIATAVMDHNRVNDIEPLLQAHYAEDCVSVEASGADGGPREAVGLEAIRAKHDWWAAQMEMHDGDLEGPYLFDPDRFAIRFTMDATNKQTGERMQGAEIALYTVANGKIVREEFFWQPQA